MGHFGVKVSKPGLDVKSKNPQDFSYSSKSASSRVKMAVFGEIVIPAGSSVGTLTINHNLGYTPVAHVVIPRNTMLPTMGGGTDYITETYYVNNTQLVVKMKVGGIFVTYGAANNYLVVIMKDQLK
jgi:hypothetical protein